MFAVETTVCQPESEAFGHMKAAPPNPSHPSEKWLKKRLMGEYRLPRAYLGRQPLCKRDEIDADRRHENQAILSVSGVSPPFDSDFRGSSIAESIVSIEKFTTDNNGIQSVFFSWGICTLALFVRWHW